MSKFMDNGVEIAIGVLVFGILVAFLLPISIGGMAENNSDEYNQTAGNTIEITSHLEGTVNTVDNTNGNIDVTLNDTKENIQKTVTIGEGTNTTVSMPDGDIIVHNHEQFTDSARVEYEYPQEYGWSGGASALWGLLPLFFVLTIVLFVVAKARKSG